MKEGEIKYSETFDYSVTPNLYWNYGRLAMLGNKQRIEYSMDGKNWCASEEFKLPDGEQIKD